MGDIPLKVVLYSDQLGVTKKVIHGHVSFRYSERPLSFTKRVDFFGLNNSVYSIYVSGTCDSSILTNYPYIQRVHPNNYEISNEKEGPVMIQEHNMSDDEEEEEQKDNASNLDAPSVISKNSNSSRASRSAKNILGYDPIKPDILFLCAENARKWLNYHVLTSKITDYPRSIIEENGK
jgi:hypothetical protein